MLNLSRVPQDRPQLTPFEFGDANPVPVLDWRMGAPYMNLERALAVGVADALGVVALLAE